MFDQYPTDANRKTIESIILFNKTSIVEPDSEGTPEQALLSGIINADDAFGDGFQMTDDLYIQQCFFHYDNMGYSL
jgi:hypothetical protein